jgi:3-phosphoshikimate 1-carboxyvinyltransferase
LGKTPRFVRAGRLAERPFREYRSLEPGDFALPGDVSSQFVTGLLFALPLLGGDSRIRFSSPLESRGYVDMTRDVLARAGVATEPTPDGGYAVPGRQRYHAQPLAVEGDWSGAAFWYGMNALGSDITVTGLRPDSAQPDRAVADLLPALPAEVDVSQCPDIFPVLAMVAAGTARRTVFRGIRRLRLKECDRVAAMADVLGRFCVGAETREETFAVEGTDGLFRGGGEFMAFGDHRIAMPVAVGATRADAPVLLDNPDCAKKSYPAFFSVLTENLEFQN